MKGRKNYKRMKTMKNMRIERKRGQVAIYFIIALAIIAVVIAVMVYPKIKPGATEDVATNPQGYISSCLKPLIVDEIAQRAEHGGEINPEAFVLYKGQKIKYLCYSSEYYKTCVVQEPLVKERIEENLNKDMQAEAEKCVNLLVQAYENEGYKVSKTNSKIDISINPDKISVIINSPMTVTKESSRAYTSFEFDFPSRYYEILYITSSIIDYEATFGNSETSTYLNYYPDISISKDQLEDGTRIYKITNTLTNESFAFASRSLAWPPGGYKQI